MKARVAVSRRAPHAGATPVARTVRQAAPAPKPPAASAAHALATMTVQPHAPHAEGTAAPAVQLLIERATAAPPQSLPHHALIQARLGRPLPPVETYSGTLAQAALRALGARAATLGHKVLFADPYPAVATVAHEVAHVLQAEAWSNTPHGAPVGAGLPCIITPANSAAEREAAAIARTLAHPELPTSYPSADGDMRVHALAAPPIRQPLAPSSLALQRTGDAPGGLAVLERPRPAPQPDEPRSPAPPSAAPVSQPASAVAAAESAVVEDAAADLELPPAPELDMSAEDAAAREAALAEAETIMAEAEDTAALMHAFADAPPTVKAMQQGGLGEAMGGLAQREAQQMEEGLPALHATLSGEAQPAPPLAVAAPEARAVTLEATAPAPAPEPAIAETLDLGRADANADLARAATRLPTGAEPAELAEQIEGSLQSVRTTDPALTPSPGPSPAVPLAGETDPQRIADQAGEGIGGARAARHDARTKVLEGPGPEQAQPRALDESYALDGLDSPTVTFVAPVEGAERYLGMGMPPEVQAAFDEQQQGVMRASMAGAVAQTETATTERETARQAAIDEAQTRASDLSRDADAQQRTRIGEARTQIQNERQATLDEQTEAVASLENDVATRRTADREAIETRVTDDQATVAGAFTTAERDAQAEIQKGEADANAEKEKAEKASKEQSWWDQAASFVRDAFNALVDAINSIVDAVRSAVTVILDAVKAAALAIIDAAASFIKDAIEAFGEFLKLAVDGLLGGIFPELAAALTEAIDGAVAAAQQAVDVVADGLKAGVSALVDGLKAGLNKILDLYQAGLNLAIGLVQAAVTGDWSALARKLLEAVLGVIGVDPERFYAFIGRAEETFEMILDDPGGFVGNLIDALLGGVRRFGTNFLTHLQAGIIGWLTGTLGSAGITLPERFDLMGVLQLAQQILGLTWDRLRQKAVRLIGERNVALLEHVSSYVDTLVTEGWAGLWRRVQGELSALVDVVLGGIKNYLYEKVIMAAITKIASLFNPVGAVVQLVLAAWNFYTFLRDQLARLMQVVQTVVNAVGDIARRILDPAMAAVETTLAGLLPLALDLLARLLGLGNVGEKVREIVTAIQERIDAAIDGLIERVLAAFRGGGSSTDSQEEEAPVDPTDHRAVARLAVQDLERSGGGADYFALRAVLEGQAAQVEQRYSAMLEEGVGLRVEFSPREMDVADQEIDFRVTVAPNDTVEEGEVEVWPEDAASLWEAVAAATSEEYLSNLRNWREPLPGTELGQIRAIPVRLAGDSVDRARAAVSRFADQSPATQAMKDDALKYALKQIDAAATSQEETTIHRRLRTAASRIQQLYGGRASFALDIEHGTEVAQNPDLYPRTRISRRYAAVAARIRSGTARPGSPEQEIANLAASAAEKRAIARLYAEQVIDEAMGNVGEVYDVEGPVEIELEIITQATHLAITSRRAAARSGS